jgi:hypothetical protein
MKGENIIKKNIKSHELYITLAGKYHTRYAKGTVIKLRWNFKRDLLCNIT